MRYVVELVTSLNERFLCCVMLYIYIYIYIGTFVSRFMASHSKGMQYPKQR